jgi:hypothetical protein
MMASRISSPSRLSIPWETRRVSAPGTRYWRELPPAQTPCNNSTKNPWGHSTGPLGRFLLSMVRMNLHGQGADGHFMGAATTRTGARDESLSEKLPKRLMHHAKDCPFELDCVNSLNKRTAQSLFPLSQMASFLLTTMGKSLKLPNPRYKPDPLYHHKQP